MGSAKYYEQLLERHSEYIGQAERLTERPIDSSSFENYRLALLSTLRDARNIFNEAFQIMLLAESDPILLSMENRDLQRKLKDDTDCAIRMLEARQREVEQLTEERNHLRLSCDTKNAEIADLKAENCRLSAQLKALESSSYEKLFEQHTNANTMRRLKPKP